MFLWVLRHSCKRKKNGPVNLPLLQTWRQGIHISTQSTDWVKKLVISKQKNELLKYYLNNQVLSLTFTNTKSRTVDNLFSIMINIDHSWCRESDTPLRLFVTVLLQIVTYLCSNKEIAQYIF